MKRSRHSAEQIITKLREADAMLAGGKTIDQVVQTLEVSSRARTLGPHFWLGIEGFSLLEFHKEGWSRSFHDRRPI